MTGGWLCLVCATKTNSDTRGQAYASRGLCCRCRNDKVTVRWAPQYDQQAHAYVPDAMAMGDCRTCGHVADSPQHEAPKQPDDLGQLSMF